MRQRLMVGFTVGAFALGGCADDSPTAPAAGPALAESPLATLAQEVRALAAGARNRSAGPPGARR